LGDEAKIRSMFDSKGYEVKAEIIEPEKSEYLEDFTNTYYEMRKAKGMTLEEAEKDMKTVLFFGAMLVKKGIADGAVAGACNTTGDVLRAAIRIIGTKAGMRTVSSCFLMATPKPEFGKDGVVLFADCAVNPNPDARTLGEIAVSTAASCKAFLETEPKVAMLSFSTKGSAEHDDVTKVREALAVAKELDPELAIDGELQADAALLQAVGDKKAPGSDVAGQANVLVFPDLDAGNIGYKLVERIAGADAIGPVIQGLAKPVNDLSRGCKYMDIVNVAAITAVQAD
jgi:phosphate acetyltransferase